MKHALLSLAILLSLATPALPPRPAPAPPPTAERTGRRGDRSGATTSPATAPTADKVDETPIVTHHEIKLGDKPLKYTATAAQMPLKTNTGETEAHIFYMAYTVDTPETDRATRPLT